MTNNHMRIFVEVFRCLNMTRAAENLNMTQPAVTRAIKDIESYYGLRLFERYNKGLYPTEKAKAFYYKALTVISDFNLMEKELQDPNRIGTLRLGATISLGIYMLPKLVREINGRHPGLDVKVTIENGAAIEGKLLSNELDIAFIEGPVMDPNLVKKSIFVDRLVVIASPETMVNGPVTLKDISAMPLLCREKGSVTRNYIESTFLTEDLTMNPIWESESAHALINAVHEGIGVSILPEKIVRHFLQIGWVKEIRLSDVCLTRTDHIVVHKDKYISDVLNELLGKNYRNDYADSGYDN
ncbi:MAG: LysR family transcriptional regulator [Spirochaetales bacterium]|nr:LysR family transcriptional regulator [Spirochaetales bacterium]